MTRLGPAKVAPLRTLNVPKRPSAMVKLEAGVAAVEPSVKDAPLAVVAALPTLTVVVGEPVAITANVCPAETVIAVSSRVDDAAELAFASVSVPPVTLVAPV